MATAADHKALKKLEDQLNCPLCLETYTDPKQLRCHHVYCSRCVVKLVTQDKQGQLILPCPTCRRVTPVPASGVTGLQAAFQINQFLEIVEEHKNATASVERVESTFSSLHVGCPEHGGREVELYCETCGETICFKCIMVGGKHHSHKYQELLLALERYKEEVTSSLEPMEKQLVTIKKALEQLDTRCEEILYQQATIETSIHDTIAEVHQVLDVRKTELISQLHQLTQNKVKSLAVQKKQIEGTQAQLSSCLNLVRENLKTRSQQKVLHMKSTVRRVKELTSTFQRDLLEPNAQADMSLVVSAEDTTAAIQNYGQVQESTSKEAVLQVKKSRVQQKDNLLMIAELHATIAHQDREKSKLEQTVAQLKDQNEELKELVLSLERSCPVCSTKFPARISQADYEKHVEGHFKK